MADNLSEGLIFGLGNPLLDISANVSKTFLTKWGLEANGAILGDEKHEGIIDDVSNEDEPKFIAGGAVQNTMRITQWLLGKPKVCVFMGAIGNDFFGRCMELKANEDGVETLYQVDTEAKTGHCGVFISDGGKHRSLVAFLYAANNFKKEFLIKNWSTVEKARYYYISGFKLTVSPESVLELGKHAEEHNDKLCIFNLSAAYISQVFTKELNSVLPYIDLLFGNEEEVKAYAKISGWCDQDKNDFTQDDIVNLTKQLANLNKINNNKKRTVIITQSGDPVIVAWQNEVKTDIIEVPKLDDETVVDTNGAGDAFVAGYLSQLVLGKDYRQCIKIAINTAHELIKQDGCTIPKHKPNFD